MGKHQHIYGLDIVRFAAALMVAAYHLSYKSWINPNDQMFPLLKLHFPNNGALFITSFGWIGVQVFFVISGFVIAFSAQGESLSTYARRRLLRLVPAVWIIAPACAIIALIFFGLRLRPTLIQTIKTLTFIPFPTWIIGQFWTLPVEIAFYVCVGALIAAGKTSKIEWLAVGLAFLSAGYWLTRLIGNPNSHEQIARLLLLQHGEYFAIGITLYAGSHRGFTLLRCALILLCSAIAYVQIADAGKWEILGLPTMIRCNASFSIWVLLTGLVFSSVAMVGRSSKLLERAAPPIKLAGSATYPLYLIHYHLGGGVLLIGQALNMPFWLSSSAALAVAVAISLAIAKWAEPWLRAALGSWIPFGQKGRPLPTLTP